MKFKTRQFFTITIGIVTSIIVIFFVYKRSHYLINSKVENYVKKSKNIETTTKEEFEIISQKGLENINYQTDKIIREKLQVQALMLTNQISSEMQSAINILKYLSLNKPSFQIISKSKKLNDSFSEITYFDNSGFEKIKISNFDKINKNIKLKKNTFLSAETYWKRIQNIKKGGVFVSHQVGLYRPFIISDKAEIKYNYKNVLAKESAYAGVENPIGKKFQGYIRFVTPYFENGKKVGFYTILYNTDKLRSVLDQHNPENPNQLRQSADGSNGSYAFMQDYNGTTLSHPRNELIMGVDKKGDFINPWTGINKGNKIVPNLDQLKEGKIPTDCRFLTFASHCKDWLNIYSKRIVDTIVINWADKQMYSTIAPIYYKNLNGLDQDFGYVILNYNIDQINSYLNNVSSSYQNLTSKSLTTINEMTKDLVGNAKDQFVSISSLYTFLVIILLVIAFVTIYLWYRQKKNRLIEKQKIIEQRHINTALKNLSHQVSHDIRSPLSSIRVLFESLNTRLDDDEQKLAEHTIERMDDILATLDGRLKSKNCKNVLDLSKEINKIIIEKKLEYKNLNEIEISFFDKSDGNSFVNMDKSEFSRMISNIINNSVEAKKLNSSLSIFVTLYSKNGRAIIDIKDNGKGIPSSIINNITELGFSYGKQYGSGLGLATAEKLVKSVNGKLFIDSIFGKETTISIMLPLHINYQFNNLNVELQNNTIL